MSIQSVTYLVGIVLGSLAVISVCVVWIRHHQFGMGGTTLTLIGFGLVGLSLWSTVQIRVSADGFETRFETLQNQVAELAETTEATINTSRQLAEVVTEQDQELARFSTLLARDPRFSDNPAITPANPAVINRGDLQRQLQRLDDASNTLQRLQSEMATP